MKEMIWGVRTLARRLNVKRDNIRDVIDSKRIKPNKLKKGGIWYNVFDIKTVKKLEKHFAEKKKAD